MPTTNVDASDGLTNSAMGTINNVVIRFWDGKLLVEAILVEFDSKKVSTRMLMIVLCLWNKYRQPFMLGARSAFKHHEYSFFCSFAWL